MKFLLRASCLLVLCVIVSFFMAPSLFAQGYAKEGVTVSLVVSRMGPGWDVGDGEIGSVVGRDEYLFIPETSARWGYGFSLGAREKKWAIDFSYLTARVKGSYEDVEMDTRYNIISIDLKRHFFYNTRVQPFILIGWIPAAWVRVKDGSFTLDTTGTLDAWGSATFSSFLTGAEAGAGLTFFITPDIALSGSAIYRRINFGTARGVSGDSVERIEGPLKGRSIGYQVGVTFTF
jgi:hypothetical protein